MTTALLALLLSCAAGARAQAPAPVADVQDYSSWRSLKRQDAQASLAFIRFYDAYPGLVEEDRQQVRHLVSEEIWAKLEEIERNTISSRDELVAAIELKRGAGSIDDATAADLTRRIDRIRRARLYYEYGNFWQRIMLEGFGDAADIPVKVQSILSGESLRLKITDDEYHAVEDANKFDPAAYGLPDLFFKYKKPT